MERRVKSERLTRINTEDFETEDLFFKLEGNIGMSLGVERVVNKDALGFGGWLL